MIVLLANHTPPDELSLMLIYIREAASAAIDIPMPTSGVAKKSACGGTYHFTIDPTAMRTNSPMDTPLHTTSY
jgi:hypothetical protein